MRPESESLQLAGEIPCSNSSACPLSRVREGGSVRIKELIAPPEVSKRLREIGFVEHQVIRLIASQSNLICQVCNARLALSAALAQMILVEPVPIPVCCDRERSRN